VQYFSQYGEVQASVIKQEKYGIAYVIFKDNAGAVAVRAGLPNAFAPYAAACEADVTLSVAVSVSVFC
jgi:hypothetical protein